MTNNEDKKEKPSIVLLHGWGLHASVYQQLITLLKEQGYPVYAFDFPGFGLQPLQSTVMKLDDYVTFLHEFLIKKKLLSGNAPIVLVGHSFGGRVAVKYIARYPKDISRLVLTGVPVIRHTSFKRKITFLVAVTGGKMFAIFPLPVKDFLRKILYKFIGEWDYYKAGPLKQVFKNIISEDLVQYAKTITIPTLLLWGDEDKIVPVTDVEKIKKIMSNAKIAIVEGTGHKLPYTKPKEFAQALQKFL